MGSKLHRSAGYKTFSVAVGSIEHRVSIRRLPMRPGDNDVRYRVRLMRLVLNGETISNRYRDVGFNQAFNIYEQNVQRLADMVGI